MESKLKADPAMGARHFRCRIDAGWLLVEALGDPRPDVWVNGRRISRVRCKTGDWIQTGTTMFCVTLLPAVSPEVIDNPVEASVRLLVSEVDRLYVLFDLADCGGIDGFLPQWRKHATEMAKSPDGGVVYLCSIRGMPEAIRPLLESGLGERYGIWIRQDRPGLAPHLLRYMNGRRWFPLYQPSVLTPFWEGLPEVLRTRFLGPMGWIGVWRGPDLFTKLAEPTGSLLPSSTPETKDR
jgi:hypothetical protein